MVTTSERSISHSTVSKSAVRNGTASQPGHTWMNHSRAALIAAAMT